MPITVSNNNNAFTAKDIVLNAGGAAAGGAVYLAANKAVKRATLPYLSALMHEEFRKTDTVTIKNALSKVLNTPPIARRKIRIIDFSRLPKISAPQSKWDYIFNKVNPENIDRTGYSKEILQQEQKIDSILKCMVPKWKRRIKGLPEHHQKMSRYMLQEGLNAMALPNANSVMANMSKMNAAVFHEIGHLLDPVANIKAIKFKRPLPYLIIGSLLMPKLETGDNGEKKVNKFINYLRNCTPILAAAAWLPVIGTEGLASEKGLNLAKPYLSENNLNIIKKAYKYAGSTYVMGAVATGLALFAGLKCKDWFLNHRKQIAQKVHDKI